MITDRPDDENYKRALADAGTPAPASQPVVSRPMSMQRISDNPNQQADGLRAVLAPYQSRGNFRPLGRNEKNAMQMQYRDIANMRGLSNNQRERGLLQMKNQMAQYGMKPTFDLSSNKGLSQAQIMRNSLDSGVLDRMRLDRQQAIGGALALHENERDRYLRDYGDVIWG